MPGIGKAEFPKGMLSFRYLRKEKECWAYARNRCSLHTACLFTEEGDERGGYRKLQDTPESAMGTKALAPALDSIFLSPYKSKLRERMLFFCSSELGRIVYLASSHARLLLE